MSILAFPAHEQIEDKSAVPRVQPGAQTRGGTEPSRRRGPLEQGRALEALGHAVEYLIDSRLFHLGDHNVRDEQEAAQILMRMSRAVFAECPEVESIRKRMRLWVLDRFSSTDGLAERG